MAIFMVGLVLHQVQIFKTMLKWRVEDQVVRTDLQVFKRESDRCRDKSLKRDLKRMVRIVEAAKIQNLSQKERARQKDVEEILIWNQPNTILNKI